MGLTRLSRVRLVLFEGVCVCLPLFGCFVFYELFICWTVFVCWYVFLVTVFACGFLLCALFSVLFAAADACWLCLVALLFCVAECEALEALCDCGLWCGF